MPFTSSPDDLLAEPAVDLKHRIRSGTRATAIAQLLGQVIQIGIVAALYRLLVPTDFGLFWKVVPIVVLLRTFATLGFNVATVQQQHLNRSRLSALFWLTAASGALTTLILVALSPLLARNQPELLPLALTMSGITFAVALSAQHQALLERTLRLSQLSAARIVAYLLGGAAAIGAAASGAGVWSLVAQWYVESGALCLLCWWLEPWRPGWRFHWSDARLLLHFAGYFSAASAMFALAHNTDKLLLGYLLEPALADQALGYYSQAFNWMMKPLTLVTTPLASVLLPALSRSVRDSALYRDVLFGFTRLVAILLIPAGVGMAIVAPEAMHLIAGPNWAEAGRLLRVLSIAITVQGFINAAGSILLSVGQTGRLFAASIVIASLHLVAYGIGLAVGIRYGQPAMGVAASYSLVVLLVFAPYMVFCLRRTGVPAGDWFRVLWPIIGASASMGLSVALTRYFVLYTLHLSPLSTLAITVPLGIALMALLARSQVQWFWGQMQALRSR